MNRYHLINHTAHGHNKTGCSACYQINNNTFNHCHHCGSRLHKRKKDSLQKTIALLITSIILYIPANLYPIMVTTYLGEKTSSTILGGVITLWEHGSYPIALIIFIASVFVPLVKIVALSWLCFSVKTKRIRFLRNNHTMYRFTEFIGRWSMVDIFVVTVLVALIQKGSLMNIMPGEATIAFAAMVITTMLAASSFEPRLIWDKLYTKEVQ